MGIICCTQKGSKFKNYGMMFLWQFLTCALFGLGWFWAIYVTCQIWAKAKPVKKKTPPKQQNNKDPPADPPADPVQRDEEAPEAAPQKDQENQNPEHAAQEEQRKEDL